MNIEFKKCISENEKAHKEFTGSSVSFTFDFKDASSVFEPVVIIETSANLFEYNYAEISNLGRKYFITDIVLLHNNIYQISLHVDVLSTYITELLNVPAVIKRQENKYNLYLDDPEFKTYNYEVIVTKKFPSNNFRKTLTYLLLTNEG